jgi:hypothetical protein
MSADIYQPDTEPVTVTLHQAGQLVEQALANKGHLWLLGPSGCGKTMIVEQSIQKYAADTSQSYKIISRNPAMEASIDNRGALCGVSTGEPEFIPIGDMALIFDDGSPACADLIAVFLDDFTNAPEPVQKAYMPMLLNNRGSTRYVQGRPIRSNVVFIVAGNRREDKSGVRGVLHAVTGRADCIVTIEPTVEEWVEWAIPAGIPECVYACVSWNPAVFNEKEARTDMQKVGNSRNWAALGYIERDWTIAEAIAYQTYVGAVGQKAADVFVAFKSIMDELPDTALILIDPDAAAIPEDNPGAMWGTCANLVAAADLDNFQKIVRYTDRFRDREFAVFTILAIVKAHEELCSTKEYIDWNMENKEIRY